MNWQGAHQARDNEDNVIEFSLTENKDYIPTLPSPVGLPSKFPSTKGSKLVLSLSQGYLLVEVDVVEVNVRAGVELGEVVELI